MTARKPPLPPKPKLTRAPAKTQPESKNPITTEIMQRIRRVIAKSDGQITIQTIAEELDIPRQACSEYISCSRATPGGDRFAKFFIWIHKHDPTFRPDVLDSKTIRFRGEVEDISHHKLSDAEKETIRNSTEPGIVLAKRHNVHFSMITHIRKGRR